MKKSSGIEEGAPLISRIVAKPKDKESLITPRIKVEPPPTEEVSVPSPPKIKVETPVEKKPKEKKETHIWMNCKVANSCKGTKAILKKKEHLSHEGVGRIASYRYQCLTCKGSYTIINCI